MNSPASHPRLPEWPFVLTSLVLLAAAGYIGFSAGDTLSPTAMLAIAACVGLSAIVLLAPWVARYERLKNAALDERQRSLEAIAGAVAAATDQISIAATGLHNIADLAHKNLKQAEQLPHKLQEKIAEFQAQLATAADAEKEELERELLALRTSESERLESVSQRIAKLTAEWAKLEIATRDHLAGLTREIDARIARLEALGRPTEPVMMAAPVPATAEPETTAVAVITPESEPVALTPKRPRKPRRDPAAAVEGAAEPAGASPEQPVADVRIEEPPPIPAATIVEVTPVAPGTAEPFHGHIASTPLTAPPTTVDEPLAALRKRVAKKAPDDDTPSLGLDLSESSGGAHATTGERTLTSDGATRLVATAYIGIGNRLFIRGEGPGLTWEKGVPLQFVSIGKWRWETNDANAPVHFKLYKNDEIECAALGAQSLDPGYQQEVTAAF